MTANMVGNLLPKRVLLFLLHVFILLALPCHSLSNANPGTAGPSKPKPPSSTNDAKRPSVPRARGAAWSSHHNRNGYALHRGSKDAPVQSKNRKRSPRWETEGDSLYHLIPQDDDKPVEYASPADELQAAKVMLKNAFLDIDGESERKMLSKISPNRHQAKKELEEPKKAPPSHAMWGSCSVGPILRARLAAMDSPTPIQEAAFPLLATQKMRSNAVIASPTGTGKTLAYLLPLMAALQQKNLYSLLIVTPTVELAVQIQKQVNLLWPPSPAGTSSCIVVESKKDEPAVLGRAPILVGTPRALRQVLLETKASNRKLYAEVRANLKTIVLDEADRLLRTEGAARESAQSSSPASVKEQIRRKRQKKKQTASPTELLLTEFPTLHYSYGSANRIQLVCASATVGRTLRRQIMALTNAPSMEKAAVLVSADARTTKDAALRKASLLPPTIQHEYFYTGNTALNDGTIDTVDLLWDTMKRLTPAPTLLFPGKAGVMSVVEGLQSKYGFQDVRTLRDTEGEIWDPAAPAKKWKDTTIYVVGEKFGRGLDIDGGVSYVLLSSPPSSPAAYLHLAGRTGRNGQLGRVVTLMNGMKEAKLVPAMGQALGITFSDLEPTVASDEADSPTTDVTIDPEVVVSETAPIEEDQPTGETNHPWKELSKTALTKKTVAEIVEYLTERGVSATDESGKRMLKADLVAAVPTIEC